MKKLFTCLFSFLIITPSAYADGDFDLTSILDIISNIYGVNLQINDSNKVEEEKLKNINDALTGTRSYGSQHYNSDAYDWGSSANNWQAILAMSRSQSGSGELVSVIRDVANQFPIDNSLNSSNNISNNYYELQASTTLASRASSELAFNQVSKQETTLHKLHDLIDTTKDSKSSSDLNNRFASENAALQIEQTKLLAILVQQAAVDAQEKSNRAEEDKLFYTNYEAAR